MCIERQLLPLAVFFPKVDVLGFKGKIADISVSFLKVHFFWKLEKSLGRNSYNLSCIYLVVVVVMTTAPLVLFTKIILLIANDFEIKNAINMF